MGFLPNGLPAFHATTKFMRKFVEKLNSVLSRCLVDVGVQKPLVIKRRMAGKVIIGIDPESGKKIIGDEKWILVSDSPDFAELLHGDPQDGDDDKKVTLTASAPLVLSAPIVMEHDETGHYVNSTEIISALSLTLTPSTTVVTTLLTGITSVAINGSNLEITMATIDHTVKTTAAGIVVESTYGNAGTDVGSIAVGTCP